MNILLAVLLFAGSVNPTYRKLFRCPKEAVPLTLRRLFEPGAQDFREGSELMVPGRHVTDIVALQSS
jgi:hypothetical protein